MTEPNGFTTKDMLIRLDEKLDKMDEKLDSKVDGSFFERMWEKLEQRVTELQIKHAALDEQVRVQDKVNQALSKKARQISEESASNFTRREKILGVLFGAVALAVQLYVQLGG
jgi:predicted RNase H-like nuclease (RuvC/YqgF family)